MVPYDTHNYVPLGECRCEFPPQFTNIMSMMDSFVPQEDLLGEVSAGNGAAAVSPVATSPVVPPEFEDNENEEIKKICSENNGELNESESGVTYSAEPTISLT